jgi:3-hydroxyisobutyrate dehydrogenase
MDEPRSVGLIGLGLMGSAVAERLASEGFALTVSSLAAHELSAARQLGAATASNPAEVAHAAEIVLVCVTDEEAISRVALGSAGLAVVATSGHVFVDLGTTDPRLTRQVAHRLWDEGSEAAWVDAPVSGGPDAARAGTLAMFVGGSDPAVAKALPVLRTLSKNPTHLGSVGVGQWFKVVNQILVLNGVVVLAEALAMAKAAGIDLKAVPSALASGYADSVLLQKVGPTMASGDTVLPRGRLGIAVRDLELIQSLGRGLGVEVPMSRTAADRFDMAMDMGLGDFDVTSVAQTYLATTA